MKFILSKSIIIAAAFFLFILSQLPVVFLNFLDSNGDTYGIAYKNTPPFIILALAVVTISIFIGIKCGFYNNYRKSFSWKNILFIFSLLIVTFFIQKFVVQFITSHNLYNVSHQITNQMKVENILSSLLFPGQFVAVSILAPILEESIYRAFFYKLFGYKWWTFILSCFFFSYVHSGFSWDILGYLPLSVALTYVYHRRKVLTDSILLHSLYNTLLLFVF